MREVWIVGVGMTRFGKLSTYGVRELAEEAVFHALKDAGAKPADIEVAYCGTEAMGPDTPMLVGQIALEQMGIKGIPITNVANACGSGSNAVREAWLALQSGLYDVALALGVEKLTSPHPDMFQLLSRLGGADLMLEGCMGFFPPGVFSMAALKHMERYGTTREQIAMVAVKNNYNGSLNPKAHYQKPVTVEDVLHSRPVSYPLNVLDCCPISDGAAAVVLCAAEAAKRFTGVPVRMRAAAHKSGTYRDDTDLDADTTRRAAREAYEMAGLGPDDIDLAEVHDCFTFAEIQHYEDLGFCKPGEGGRFVEEGHAAIGGRIAVNPSGGLLAKGHPLGATGPGQVNEVVEQLRGRCGKRQVPDARIGMTHNGGGFRHGDTGIVVSFILEKMK
ncbi:MAG: beta-ketoacyl synthase N-terminal-like domain-containing protein [bacterium]